MNPGKLDKYIIFRNNVAALQRDEMGGKLPAVWEDLFGCWAKKERTKPTLKEYSGQNVNYINVTFTIRKPRIDIDTSMQIMYKSRVYKILAIVDLETIPEYYAVDALLLQPGG